MTSGDVVNYLISLRKELYLPMYTMAGAMILWCKLGKKGRDTYALSELLARYISNQEVRVMVEPPIFIVLGTIISMGLVHPATEMQALTGGLGWVALLSK